jgi:hypothetical protein
VPLGGGAVLLLPGQPGPDDLAAIQTAARPLLDLLAGRGLLDAVPWRPARDWLASPDPLDESSSTTRGSRTQRSPS